MSGGIHPFHPPHFSRLSPHSSEDLLQSLCPLPPKSARRGKPCLCRFPVSLPFAPQKTHLQTQIQKIKTLTPMQTCTQPEFMIHVLKSLNYSLQDFCHLSYETMQFAIKEVSNKIQSVTLLLHFSASFKKSHPLQRWYKKTKNSLKVQIGKRVHKMNVYVMENLRQEMQSILVIFPFV